MLLYVCGGFLSFFCSNGRSTVVIKCDLRRKTHCEMFKALAPCLQWPVPVGEPSCTRFRKLGLMLVLLKIATSFLQKHGLQENWSLYQDQLSFRVKALDWFVALFSVQSVLTFSGMWKVTFRNGAAVLQPRFNWQEMRTLYEPRPSRTHTTTRLARATVLLCCTFQQFTAIRQRIWNN